MRFHVAGLQSELEALDALHAEVAALPPIVKGEKGTNDVSEDNDVDRVKSIGKE